MDTQPNLMMGQDMSGDNSSVNQLLLQQNIMLKNHIINNLQNNRNELDSQGGLKNDSQPQPQPQLPQSTQLNHKLNTFNAPNNVQSKTDKSSVTNSSVDSSKPTLIIDKMASKQNLFQTEKAKDQKDPKFDKIVEGDENLKSLHNISENLKILTNKGNPEMMNPNMSNYLMSQFSNKSMDSGALGVDHQYSRPMSSEPPVEIVRNASMAKNPNATESTDTHKLPTEEFLFGLGKLPTNQSGFYSKGLYDEGLLFASNPQGGTTHSLYPFYEFNESTGMLELKNFRHPSNNESKQEFDGNVNSHFKSMFSGLLGNINKSNPFS